MATTAGKKIEIKYKPFLAFFYAYIHIHRQYAKTMNFRNFIFLLTRLTYAAFALPPRHKTSNKLHQMHVLLNGAAAGKTGGEDERFAGKETDAGVIDKIHEYFVKKDFLQKLENEQVPELAKLKIVHDYNARNSQLYSRTNLFHGLSITDF